MKNCRTIEFLEHTQYEECAVLYNNTKYFFHGLMFDENEGQYTYVVDVWDKGNRYEKTVINVSENNAQACIDKALKENAFEGKSFWDVESDLEWIEW